MTTKPDFTQNELDQLIPVIGEITDSLLISKDKIDFLMVTDQQKVVDQYKENYSQKEDISIRGILQKDSHYKLFYIWTRDAIEKESNQILNLRCFSKRLIPERKKLFDYMKQHVGTKCELKSQELIKV